MFYLNIQIMPMALKGAYKHIYIYIYILNMKEWLTLSGVVMFLYMSERVHILSWP